MRITVEHGGKRLEYLKSQRKSGKHNFYADGARGGGDRALALLTTPSGETEFAGDKAGEARTLATGA